MVYLITYDLNKAGQDYTSLYETIKSNCSAWAHCLDSTWFIDTNKTEEQVRDALLKVMDKNDLLFITKISKPYKGWLTDDTWKWLSEHV